MGLLDFKSSNQCIMLPSYTHACVALECALCFCVSVTQGCSTLPTRWQCTTCLESLPCCINGIYLLQYPTCPLAVYRVFTCCSTLPIHWRCIMCLPVAVPYPPTGDVPHVWRVCHAVSMMFTCCSTKPTRWQCTMCLESLPCCINGVYLLQYSTCPLAMYHVFTCCSTLPIH